MPSGARGPLSIGRWPLRLALAAGVAALRDYLYEPDLELNFDFFMRRRVAVFSVVFVLVVLGDLLVSRARRRPSERHAGVMVSFVTGAVSGLLTLTFWGAFLALPIAAIGIAAARRALKREKGEGGGHSVLNRVGLVLNVLAFGVGVLVLLILMAAVFR